MTRQELDVIKEFISAITGSLILSSVMLSVALIGSSLILYLGLGNIDQDVICKVPTACVIEGGK